MIIGPTMQAALDSLDGPASAPSLTEYYSVNCMQLRLTAVYEWLTPVQPVQTITDHHRWMSEQQAKSRLPMNLR